MLIPMYAEATKDLDISFVDNCSHVDMGCGLVPQKALSLAVLAISYIRLSGVLGQKLFCVEHLSLRVVNQD